MKKFVETVVGGAVGIIALYVVGVVAYKAGREMAQEECRYNAMLEAEKKRESPALAEGSSGIAVVPEKPEIRKRGVGFGGLFRKGNSVIKNLIAHPDEHRLEAYVSGDMLTVNVSRSDEQGGR